MLEDLFTNFVEDIEYHKPLRDTTKKNFHSYLRMSAGVMNLSPADMVARFHENPSKAAYAIQEALRESGKAESTRVSLMRMWQAFAAYLWKSGRLEKPSFVHVQKEIRTHVDPDIQLGNFDLVKIAEHVETLPEPARTWNQALLHALFPTLLRASEITSITVDWQPGFVDIREKGYRSKTKVAVNEETAEAFERLKRRVLLVSGGNTTAPLFPPPIALEGRGKCTPASVDTIAGAVGQWGEFIGKKISPHDFRHSGITLLLDKGVPVSDVAALSRHSSDWIVKRYDRHLGTRSRSAADVLQNVVKGAYYATKPVGNIQNSSSNLLSIHPGSHCAGDASGSLRESDSQAVGE